VFYSLKKARDNARSVREALTLECFINLNETYRELEAYNRRRLSDPATFRTAMQSTHRGILSAVGAIEHTLTRDAGWLFLKLGESLERVFRTTVILRTKLPALVATEPKIDLPLFYSQWRASCAASLENYRVLGRLRRSTMQFLSSTCDAPSVRCRSPAGVPDRIQPAT
jgi:uncharacterized alpha-E superfamily protein